MKISSRLAPEITPKVIELCRGIVPDGMPVYVEEVPQDWAEPSDCFNNIQSKINFSGGEMVLGWNIIEWVNVLVEAEFHAVWKDPQGNMLDITPKPISAGRILFLPDTTRKYEKKRINNFRLGLRDEWIVKNVIRLSEAVFQEMDGGDKAFETSFTLTERLRELATLQAAHTDALNEGLTDDSPCFCGSSKPYKRCCGKKAGRICR